MRRRVCDRCALACLRGAILVRLGFGVALGRWRSRLVNKCDSKDNLGVPDAILAREASKLSQVV